MTGIKWKAFQQHRKNFPINSLEDNDVVRVIAETYNAGWNACRKAMISHLIRTINERDINDEDDMGRIIDEFKKLDGGT